MGLRERFQIFGFETTCVHFHRQRIYTEPTLYLDGQPIPCPPPWEEHQINFDISPTKQKKEDTREAAYQKEFLKIKEKNSNYYAVYTDSSKLEEKVAAAAYFPQSPDCSKVTRLRDGSSVVLSSRT
ncbi:hypothetical protein PoB_003978400 [Plakobranchus ocellatus]|uniref:Uncharacterized protein n=1 Tax=Plakobranchus ocellatus TaxID=259542 RepID=A0AAV4AZV5_9GAST|nr:hypothetical protein PoB_003978400 [Plakobranchus ocellatus]